MVCAPTWASGTCLYCEKARVGAMQQVRSSSRWASTLVRPAACGAASPGRHCSKNGHCQVGIQCAVCLRCGCSASWSAIRRKHDVLPQHQTEYGALQGIMTAYGSYAPTSTNVYADSAIVAYLNCGTSVIAGFSVRLALLLLREKDVFLKLEWVVAYAVPRRYVLLWTSPSTRVSVSMAANALLAFSRIAKYMRRCSRFWATWRTDKRTSQVSPRCFATRSAQRRWQEVRAYAA